MHSQESHTALLGRVVLSALLCFVSVVDPKVSSIANRVAEIVYSWPPPEVHRQGPSSGASITKQLLHIELEGGGLKASSSKKGTSPFRVSAWGCWVEVYTHFCIYLAQKSAAWESVTTGSKGRTATYTIRLNRHGKIIAVSQEKSTQ